MTFALCATVEGSRWSWTSWPSTTSTTLATPKSALPNLENSHPLPAEPCSACSSEFDVESPPGLLLLQPRDTLLHQPFQHRQRHGALSQHDLVKLAQVEALAKPLLGAGAKLARQKLG